MKTRYQVLIVLVAVALVLFLKDDRLRRDGRARLFRQASAALAHAEQDKEFIQKMQELKSQAQELTDKAAPSLRFSQEARNLDEKARSMMMNLVSRENALREEFNHKIDEYNALVSEFNKLPPSLFEKDGVPRRMEKSNQAL